MVEDLFAAVYVMHAPSRLVLANGCMFASSHSIEKDTLGASIIPARGFKFQAEAQRQRFVNNGTKPLCYYVTKPTDLISSSPAST